MKRVLKEMVSAQWVSTGHSHTTVNTTIANLNLCI